MPGLTPSHDATAYCGLPAEKPPRVHVLLKSAPRTWLSIGLYCGTGCHVAQFARGLTLALLLLQALQCLVNIQRSLVDWYQVTTANAAHAAPAVAPGAMADADADDQHMLESDPKPAPAGTWIERADTVSRATPE